MATFSNPKFVHKKSLTAKELMTTYLKLYCDRSTIHGVQYLFKDDINEFDRVCWTAIVILSIFMTVSVYLFLSQQYNNQLILTFVDESQYPVFKVLFPAVAVCSQKRVDWNKFEAAKSMFLPGNATKETHAIFYDFVKRMESLRFGSFSDFSNMEGIDLERLEFINVSQVAQFLTYHCADIFDSDCFWNRELFSCCDMFVMEKTEVGFCMVFNSVISSSSRKKIGPFYPLSNYEAGEDSGLNFKLKLNVTTNGTEIDDKVFLMIKKAEQWSDVVYTIQGNTDTLVSVKPSISTTDLSAREIPAEIRGCVFDMETEYIYYRNIKGLAYRQWNCLNICHEEYLLQYCNCTLSMFFPHNVSYRECSPADFRCMYKYQDIFSFDKRLNEDSYVKNLKGGMLCPCLISCDFLEYFVTVSTLPIINHESNDTKIMTIDVHYQSEVMLKYRTIREFTYLELIASLGGIIGLFLGASVVSGIEIIYHLTFGLYIFLKHNDFFDQMWDRIRKSWHRNRISSSSSLASSSAPRVAWPTSTNRRRY